MRAPPHEVQVCAGIGASAVTHTSALPGLPAPKAESMLSLGKYLRNGQDNKSKRSLAGNTARQCRREYGGEEPLDECAVIYGKPVYGLKAAVAAGRRASRVRKHGSRRIEVGIEVCVYSASELSKF